MYQFSQNNISPKSFAWLKISLYVSQSELRARHMYAYAFRILQVRNVNERKNRNTFVLDDGCLSLYENKRHIMESYLSSADGYNNNNDT